MISLREPMHNITTHMYIMNYMHVHTRTRLSTTNKVASCHGTGDTSAVSKCVIKCMWSWDIVMQRHAFLPCVHVIIRSWRSSCICMRNNYWSTGNNYMYACACAYYKIHDNHLSMRNPLIIFHVHDDSTSHMCLDMRATPTHALDYLKHGWLGTMRAPC